MTTTAERVRWARRSAARRGTTDWYRVENSAPAAESTTVWLYEEIGGWCGLDAAEFVQDLAAITTARIELRINSPGGSVFDGVAIHNSLVDHPAAVDVHVDGLAASIASVIAMAGDTITMGAGTQMMIHDGWGLCVGNAADMRVLADLLDQISDDIAGFYARRTGGALADWREVMRAETWYTADEAVEAGLADRVTTAKTAPPEDVAAARWDLSVFNYAGRDAAPPPRPARQPVPALDLSVLRSALRGSAPARSFDPEVLRRSVRQA